MEAACVTPPRALQEEQDLLDKRPSPGEAVLQKLNAHLLPKFFLLTVLCYVDRCDPRTRCARHCIESPCMTCILCI